jgi:two-component system nitrogen regulation response regulator GlnG
MAKLMVVDDEESICWALSRLGQGLGHEVTVASSAEQALELAAQDPPDAVVLDVRLPGISGLEAIGRLRQLSGDVPIIVITAYGDLKTAVDAVRQGAFEYLIKPFDLEAMERAIGRALASRQPRAALAQGQSVGGLVGRSPAMQQVFKQLALAAAADANVLLCGESGTGKELAARAIHKYSDRADGPFVAVNVAAISPALAESELFGHVRGAFTGAERERSGLLVQADGGTLFLDEVADIPLAAQIKLLRALEHGEVLPVGAGHPVMSDFRVVSATHQDLLAKVQRGEFRHDLYFRLSAFRVDLPPLRERRGDIRELAEHFLHLHGAGRQTKLPVFSESALAELERRPWYGNVRELRNAVEHALIVARAAIVEPEHLPAPADASWMPGLARPEGVDAQIAGLLLRWTESQLATGPQAGDLYEHLLRLVEPPFLRAALDAHHGQCAAAARALGLHRTTLRKKLEQYGIGGES